MTAETSNSFVLLSAIAPAIIPGIIFGIGAAGVFLITYYLRVTDLTVLGSFLFSGVAGLWAVNVLGVIPGLLVGTVAGCICGATTAALVCGLQVQSVLAGIISYCAATAAAYAVVSSEGVISRAGEGGFLRAIFSLEDLAIIAALAAGVICALHVAARTKWGGLVSALRASPPFKRCRHRYRGATVVGVYIVGNGLIGLAGALSALKTQVVAIEMSTSTDFLIKAFGAYYGGYVFAVWAKALVGIALKHLPAEVPVPELGDIPDESIGVRFSKSLHAESVESKLGLLLGAQVVGCVVLTVIALLATRSSSAVNYLIQAVLLFIFVKLAGSTKQRSEAS